MSFLKRAFGEFAGIDAGTLYGETKAESVDVNELNNITILDNNDSSRPNVHEYLTNQLSSDEVVWVAEGTHTGPEITLPSNSATVFWQGTIQPDGDHPVITTSKGQSQLTVIPFGSQFRHINTDNITGYSSDAFNVHCQLVCQGFINIISTGRRAVNIEQTGGGNTNHTTGKFRLGGADTGEVGLMVDNPSGNAPNVNYMDIDCRRADRFTDYGIYINAGFGNKYRVKAEGNGVGVAYYSGGGPRGSGTTEGDRTNRDNILQHSSDAGNTSNDEWGDSAEAVVMGDINGFAQGDSVMQVKGDGVSRANQGGIGAFVIENERADAAGEGVAIDFKTFNDVYRLMELDESNQTVELFGDSSINQAPLRGHINVDSTGGRLSWDTEDLTARNGVQQGEIAVHDGSGTPAEGTFRWDGSSWVRIEDNSVTI